MKTFTVQFDLTPADAKELLPARLRRLDALRIQVAIAEREVLELKKVAAYADTTEPLPPPSPELFVTPPRKLSSVSDRARRGESERALLEYLKLRDGDPATMKTILADTGIKRSTATRLLRGLVADGEVMKRGRRYRLSEKDSAPPVLAGGAEN